MTQTILDARARGCIMDKMKSLKFKVQKSVILNWEPETRNLKL
jgi:hypothetical protein